MTDGRFEDVSDKDAGYLDEDGALTIRAVLEVQSIM